MVQQKSLKTLSSKEMGDRIYQRRKLLDLTRRDLANQIGVSEKFIAGIENGEKGMSLQTLYKLMQVLDLSADFILLGAPFTETRGSDNAERIRQNILAPLYNLKEKDLKFMEEITKQYVQALRGKTNGG